MEHLEASNLLTHYLSDDLEPGRRRDLEAHLARCAECAEWTAAYAFIDQALGQHQSSDEVARFALAPETLDRSSREHCSEHLRRCGDCRREVDLVRQAAGVGPPADGVAVTRGPAGLSRRQAAWLAVAATAVLALGASLWLDDARRPSSGSVLADRTLSDEQTKLTDPSSILVETTEVVPGAALTLESRVVGFGHGFSVQSGATLAVVTPLKTQNDDRPTSFSQPSDL